MKKLAILTSLLALTACGGGSGGGAPSPVDLPNTLSAEQRAAQISNENVTGMNSFIIIGGSNPTTNARVATTGVKMPDGGVMYDLSNVKLHTTTFTEDFVNPDAGANIVFKTDENGKIVEIAAVGPRQFPEGIVASRTDDTKNVFTGDLVFDAYDEVRDQHGELVRDEQGNIVYNHTVLNFNNFKMSYNSFGKQKNLKYSDFGSLGLAEEGYELTEDGEFFAGGYEVKRIEPVNITETYNFSGIAKGNVSVGYEDDAPHINLIDNNATLSFNGGTSTLNANFNNWYDVSVTMGTQGNLTGIEFNNGKKTSFAEGYAFNGADANGHYGAKETQYNPGTGPNVIREGFIEYYGDGNVPSEAVGVLKYAESGAGMTANSETTRLLFNMGFGAKRN